MTSRTKVRRPRQARSKATVEAILEGAAQVLRREGLEGCTTAKIAKRAGVSVGTLYQYFERKEAVYEALIDRILDERMATRAALLAAPTQHDEIAPATTALIDSLLAVHQADPDLQRQLHRYEAGAGFERLERYQQQMQGVVAAALERDAARLRPLDAQLAARVLIHALTGVIERFARDDVESLSRPDLRREVAALVAGYLSPANPMA